MIQSFHKVSSVKGELNIPGDKSISHRAVMISSLAEGKSRIYNLSSSTDVSSTIRCFQQLGVKFSIREDYIEIEGRGFKNFIKPNNPLNAGNSGTTARLLSGILAVQDFESIIIGDESLTARPMDRIMVPLSLLGAQIKSNKGKLPLHFYPPKKIHGIDYKLPVASAQVKSTILLAGLHSDIYTSVIETTRTRNHTELMLGLKVVEETNSRKIFVSKENYPQQGNYFIPSDVSSAAFFIVLALLVKDSELLIKDICLNPTRTGFLDILKQMGAVIEIPVINSAAGELYGDLIVRSGSLKNIDIPPEIIPNIIDEIPVLAVAGIFAEGEFRIQNAGELRKKESDRISSLIYNFKLAGLDVSENEDGFSINGNIRNDPAAFESFNDHRIAMALAVLSMLMENGGKVNNFECAGISNPGFMDQLKKITTRVGDI